MGLGPYSLTIFGSFPNAAQGKNAGGGELPPLRRRLGRIAKKHRPRFQATVHVRLTAPARGTFDATTGTLRLRAYNGLRDRLQQAEGSRFFPNERTNRSRIEQWN